MDCLSCRLHNNVLWLSEFVLAQRKRGAQPAPEKIFHPRWSYGLLVARLALDHRTVIVLALIVRARIARVLIAGRPTQIRSRLVLAVFLQLVFHHQGQPLLGLLEL